ncbi:MAG: DUF4040 domain-containing protein [Rhodocyclaceae bacterium]|nr:DUF4040 domain-containing protein [Rhodocyclaceae bacterium]
MSVIALAGGVGLYFALQKKLNLHTIVKLPGDAKLLFDVFIENLTALAAAVTRWTQNGRLQRYLWLIVATCVLVVSAAFALFPSTAMPGRVLVSSEFANPTVIVIALIGMACAVFTAINHQQRMTSLLFLGMTGLVVAFAFVYFSAPDLALTQLLVEVVTIILMMLALNFLPKTSKAEAGAVRWPDAALAGLAGVGITWIVYQVLQRPFNSIAPYFLQTTVSKGGGANAVNVIIVDYRGFDTLGEIAVLGMAGLIVALLLRDFRLPNTPFDGQFGVKLAESARISLLLNTVTSLLLPMALIVSIYFYLRGHNQPGGGFIAGLVFAVALILQYVAVGQRAAEARARLRYPIWIGWGLLFAGVTGLGSALVGFPFLTSTFKYFSFPLIGAVPIASAMFFDLGVFLTVIGGTMLALATLGRLGQRDVIASTKEEAV